jgi:hypothetical protein
VPPIIPPPQLLHAACQRLAPWLKNVHLYVKAAQPLSFPMEATSPSRSDRLPSFRIFPFRSARTGDTARVQTRANGTGSNGTRANRPLALGLYAAAADDIYDPGPVRHQGRS